jgi:DNA-binding MarR family transcriptional regulator
MAANPKNIPAGALEGYYNVDTYGAEDSVGYLIGALRARLSDCLDEEMKKLGFTAAQWPILRAVADGQTPIAADLCRQLDYDTGSMTRMLNRLEEKGVIVRTPSREDRRVVRLRITPAGRRIYPKLRACTIRVLNRLVTGFSDAEVRALHASLRRMLDNVT